MAEYQVKIEGLDELQRQFKKSPEITRKRLNEAINRATIILNNYLKTGGIVPVRTGLLRQSIRPVITDLKSTIAPHTHYAIYVHEGTYKMKARPFLKTAIDDKNNEVQKQFDNAIELIAQDLTK
jgi:HK97 gp10 family phage protein